MTASELIQRQDVAARNRFTTKSRDVEQSSGVGGRENGHIPGVDLYLLNKKCIYFK